jgi:hypothetical protein
MRIKTEKEGDVKNINLLSEPSARAARFLTSFFRHGIIIRNILALSRSEC